jgi:hypothetical protein
MAQERIPRSAPAVMFFLVVLNLMRWIETLFLEGSGISLASDR